jgi:hypothetical protein
LEWKAESKMTIICEDSQRSEKRGDIRGSSAAATPRRPHDRLQKVLPFKEKKSETERIREAD